MTSRTKKIPRRDQVLEDKEHPKEGVRISGSILTSEIKGDFEVIGILEEISFVKVRASRVGSQDLERPMGILRRRTRPQEASRGGIQDLENNRGLQQGNQDCEDKGTLRREPGTQGQA